MLSFWLGLILPQFLNSLSKWGRFSAPFSSSWPVQRWARRLLWSSTWRTIRTSLRWVSRTKIDKVLYNSSKWIGAGVSFVSLCGRNPNPINSRIESNQMHWMLSPRVTQSSSYCVCDSKWQRAVHEMHLMGLLKYSDLTTFQSLLLITHSPSLSCITFMSVEPLPHCSQFSFLLLFQLLRLLFLLIRKEVAGIWKCSCPKEWRW